MRAGTDLLISVRPLKAADRTPIEGIVRRTGVFSSAEVAVAMELVDAALGNPAQKDYVMYSAEGADGEVLGYYCVGPTPMTAGTWDLYWIAVDLDHHGMDIGKTLLKHSEELVKSRGATLMVAETSSKPSYDNTNRFYLRNAYSEVARIRNYYAEGDDLVVYGKYLSHTTEG